MPTCICVVNDCTPARCPRSQQLCQNHVSEFNEYADTVSACMPCSTVTDYTNKFVVNIFVKTKIFGETGLVSKESIEVLMKNKF